MFKLFLSSFRVNYLLILIAIKLILINFIECSLRIHDSCIWIPIIDKDLSEPYFLWHPADNFVFSQQSSTVLNNDSTDTEPQNYDFFKAYPIYGGYKTSYLFSEFSRDYSIMSIDSFEPPEFISIEENIIFKRFVPLEDIFKSSFITISASDDIDNSTSWHLVEMSEITGENIEYKWTRLDTNGINLNTSDLEFKYGFLHEHKNFWFTYQNLDTTNNNDAFYSYIEVTVDQNEIGIGYTFKELYSEDIEKNYGTIKTLQFANSYYINHTDFPKLLFMSYPKSDRDRILAISFDEVESNFTEIGDGSLCDEAPANSSWWKLRFHESTNCTKYYDPVTNILYLFKKWQQFGHIIDILSYDSWEEDYWTKIIDFVPIAWEAEPPGYVLLLLSAESEYKAYRYSVHFLYSDSLYIEFLYQRIFDLHFSAFPDEQTKIYYYNLSVPQVLVSIASFHFNEELFVCSIANETCLPRSRDSSIIPKESVIVVTIVYAIVTIILLSVLGYIAFSRKKPAPSENSKRLLMDLRKKIREKRSKRLKSKLYSHNLKSIMPKMKLKEIGK